MTDLPGSTWGRIDDEGSVYVRTSTGERAVGSWRAGSPAEGLAHFVRRYDDLVAEVVLLEQRLTVPTADAKAVGASARRLRDSLPTAAVVGDVASLEKRVEGLIAAADEGRARQSAAKAQQTAAVVEAKTALVAEAETLAGSSDWKATGDRLRALADEFRKVTGIDRRADSDLWKRFTTARDEFTRRRGAHFAALDAQRAESTRRKEAICEEAESLSGSSEWGATAGRYKALMTDWKAAGRAQREVDDALWARFRAAQDAFFSRRNAVNNERDEAERANAGEREKLLAEAEALDVTDTERAARRLREIQERWDGVGRAPREVSGALERRLAAVGDKIRDSERERWRRPDPEASRLVTRLRESVAKLEVKVERARAAGRPDAAAEATLATQREWLAQATR
ncbi:MAG: DUF349 domain-containing protein [Frankia sp.]